MSDQFSEQEIESLMQTAELLMPDEGHLPSVEEADLRGTYIDLAVRAKPESLPFLREFIQIVNTVGTDSAIETVRAHRADIWDHVTAVLPGAYFISPAVKRALNYSGQTADHIPVASANQYEDLIGVVVARGTAFRPTP